MSDGDSFRINYHFLVNPRILYFVMSNCHWKIEVNKFQKKSLFACEWITEFPAVISGLG